MTSFRLQNEKERKKRSKKKRWGKGKRKVKRNEKKLGDLGAGYSESPAFASPGPLDVSPGTQWFPGAFWAKPPSLRRCKVMRGKPDLFTHGAGAPHVGTQLPSPFLGFPALTNNSETSKVCETTVGNCTWSPAGLCRERLAHTSFWNVQE